MSRKGNKRTDLLQGTLDMLILRVLSQESLHGYAVGKRLAELSEGRLQIPQGSLYPALHRIEERGLVSASWVTIRGREAKIYSMTAKGRRKMKEDVSGWEEIAAAVALVLDHA